MLSNLFSILFLFHSALAQQMPSNLIIRLAGSDRALLESRILAAAQGVGPQGHVIFDYTSPERGLTNVDRGEATLDIDPVKLMGSLPEDMRSRVLLVNSREAYFYPRDSSYGWRKLPNGANQIIGREVGNLMHDLIGQEIQSHSTLGIAALLSACEGGEFEFPSLRRSSFQGGQVVSNENGICIVNSDVIDEINNADETKVLSEIGCERVILGPDIRRLRSLGLMNGHIDLNAIFVGPDTVMIPSVAANCKTEIRNEWRKLADAVRAQGLNVIEATVAGGCIEQHPDIPQGPGSKFLRSYSNVVVLRDALLIPEFKGQDQQENERFKPYNDGAQSQLQRLMNEGKIPKRKIIGFPIVESEAKGGGLVRCMSLEVPGQIKRCSQDRLNRTIESFAVKAMSMATCLESGPTAEICKLSKEIHTTIKFLHEEPDRQRELTTSDGAIIRILNQSRDLLGTVAERLGAALKFCQAN